MKNDPTNYNKRIAKLYGETLSPNNHEVTGHSIKIVDDSMMITYYSRPPKEFTLNDDDENPFSGMWDIGREWKKFDVPLNIQQFKNWVSKNYNLMPDDILNYVIGMINYIDSKRVGSWDSVIA